jgi:hypothetical protein
MERLTVRTSRWGQRAVLLPAGGHRHAPGRSRARASASGIARGGRGTIDATRDCIAAGELDVPTIAVRTGGFAVEELTEAGATRVSESLRELRQVLDDALLARPDRTAA